MGWYKHVLHMRMTYKCYNTHDRKFSHASRHNILDEICEEAKADMKAMPRSELGSWTRAVTTSDGDWHKRGSVKKAPL